MSVSVPPADPAKVLQYSVEMISPTRNVKENCSIRRSYEGCGRLKRSHATTGNAILGTRCAAFGPSIELEICRPSLKSRPGVRKDAIAGWDKQNNNHRQGMRDSD